MTWSAIPSSKRHAQGPRSSSSSSFRSGPRSRRRLLLLSRARLPPSDRDLGACSMDMFMQPRGDAEERPSHGQMGDAVGARPIESQASFSIADGDIRRAGNLCSGGGNAGFADEDTTLQVRSEATSGWKHKVRIRKAPAERELNPNRKGALELSMRAFILKRDGNVMNSAVGTLFDSLDEAYQFYNLYSCEVGFGISYSKSRLSVERMKCMQEIVCGCAGKPEKENTRSTWCGCAARIRLLRVGFC